MPKPCSSCGSALTLAERANGTTVCNRCAALSSDSMEEVHSSGPGNTPETTAR
jgi:hypothetical protein